MKIFVAMLMFLSGNAEASVRAIWGLDGSHAVLTMPTAGMGDNNVDEQTLWDLMNVPPQDSFVGPGKVIETADKNFSLICGQRQNRVHCTVAVKRHSRAVIDARRKRLEVVIAGDEGRQVVEKFHLQNGGFVYGTGDNKLSLRGGPEGFHLLFQE